MKRRFALILTATVACAGFSARAETIRPIEFPVSGPTSYYNDFNAGRDNNSRPHEGIDIKAPKMTPAVAAVSGRVRWFTESERSYGWMVVLEDSEGYTYHYIHLNNDTPGTDDGRGGRTSAIAPEIHDGARVTKGQVIGWVGDSGNAERTVPHLHFEIHEPGGIAINPYYTLLEASRQGRYAVEEAKASSPDINADKGLQTSAGAETYCVSESLIRSVSNPAVYYCGADGRRYVFPNKRVYDSWYPDFKNVQTITDVELAAVRIGGNVTYRPGTKLVKITTDPKVYAVAKGGHLRHVASSDIAKKLYGSAWSKSVEDIPDAYFTNYRVGDPIVSAD